MVHPELFTAPGDDALSRRLALIDAESHDDPARRDLTMLDFLLLVALNVVIVGAMLWYAWG